jgi:outer membrane protein TolC
MDAVSDPPSLPIQESGKYETKWNNIACYVDSHLFGSPSPLVAEPEGAGSEPQTGLPTVLHSSARLMPPIDVAMKPALAAPSFEQVIDLREALVRGGVDNPTIALAQEAIRASEARQLQAQALLMPTLTGGGDFNWHQGKLQNGQGAIIDVQRQSAYVGAGAEAVGGGTVGFPGVSITAHLGDALFEPQVARIQTAARQFDAQATRNEVLLDVATSFFALVGAEARLQAMRTSEADFNEIARITANFAKTGQGREADAQRALTEALLHHAAAQGIEEEATVGAAELARLLNLDPNVRLVPAPGGLPLVELIDPGEDLERLTRIAIVNRPEIAASSAEVGVIQTRLKKENWRPFLPTLAVGFSAGGFGGGGSQADTSFGHWSNRTDFDVVAFWTLRNLGFGNLAVQHQLRAQIGQATAARARVIDTVREEVAEAFALAAVKRRDMEVALRRLETSHRAFQQDLTRVMNLQGLPIETLDSANLLSKARQDYLRALTGYDQAQLQLFVSLGQPPVTGTQD